MFIFASSRKSTVLCTIQLCSFFSLYAQVLTPFEHRDLQLLKTYSDIPGVIAQVDRTKTIIGHAYLEEQLLNLLVDSSQLYKRQEKVKLLLRNSELSQIISNELQLFAAHQNPLHVLKHEDTPCKKMLEHFYFKNKYVSWLNKHPIGLECGQALQMISLFAPIIEHAVIHFLVNEKLHNYLGMCCSHSHHKHKHSHVTPSWLSQTAYYTYNIAHGAIHVMGAKELFEHVYRQYQVIREMQLFLSHIRVCLQIRDRLVATLTAFPEFEELLAAENQTEEFKEFSRLVMADTINITHFEIARPGNVLRAYSLFESVQDELVNYCKPVALTDFYNSIAFVYDEHRSTNTPYTFCTYLEDQKPQLKINGFWNPLFATPQSIDFTVNVGNTDPACVVMTGQNKAGKSTNLYACVATVILGQSLGIAPAHYCAFTPFEHIFTGFNMPARVVEGASLFTTTLEFTNSIFKVAQSKRILVVLDELFNSTHHTKGATLAELFLQQLVTKTDALALVSTHFSQLHNLQHTHPNLFTMLMVERSDEDTDAQYHIERGFLPSSEYDESFNENLLYTVDVF